jgi:hypothetical protein
MVKYFGHPPWDAAHAGAAEEFRELLQAVSNVAEKHESRANKYQKVLGLACKVLTEET